MKSLRALNKALKACKDKPWMMAWAVVFDIVYGISFLSIFSYIWEKIATSIEGLGSVMSGFEKIVPEDLTDPAMVQQLAEQQLLVDGIYSDVFGWLGILIVASYFIWVTFQGGAWWIAQDIANKKFKKIQFVWRFIIISLVMALTRVLLVSVVSTITRYPLLGIITIDQPIVATLLGGLQLVLLYLMHVAYATIGNTPFWVPFSNAAWNRIGSVATGYVVIICIVMTALTVSAYLASLDLVLGFVITALVTAPALTFCRVYAIDLVKQVR